MEAIPIDSRYFAMVRLATFMPSSPSSLAILLSLNGLIGFSVVKICLISARIAVEEAAPTITGTYMAGEKVLQFKYAIGSMHVFLSGSS